jgi:hypothetical protein
MTGLENISRGDLVLIEAGASGENAIGSVSFSEQRTGIFKGIYDEKALVKVNANEGLILYSLEDIKNYDSK